MSNDPLSHVRAFLSCETPEKWLQFASSQLPTLLVDHANCEKKAAASAMNLMYRYVDRPELLQKMSQLAREELLHFEQVVSLMRERDVAYSHLGPSRYASSLRSHMRSHEPARLVDTLIIGAYVEARSCERFMALIPYLDTGLGKYYRTLLKSESRHFLDYLELARLYADDDIEDRITYFADIEKELIMSEDSLFRFHSGIPA